MCNLIILLNTPNTNAPATYLDTTTNNIARATSSRANLFLWGVIYKYIFHIRPDTENEPASVPPPIFRIAAAAKLLPLKRVFCSEPALQLRVFRSEPALQLPLLKQAWSKIHEHVSTSVPLLFRPRPLL